MNSGPIFAYAHLNARIMPLDRGARYEDPLSEALEQNGLREVRTFGR